MIWNTWKLLYEKRLLSLNRATKAYNLGQNCWDTSERMRTLTLQTSYNNKSFPLSPLSMLLCHEKRPDEYSFPPNNIDWGEGEGKHLVGYSTQGNWEIRSLIAFVSTGFVQDCRYNLSVFFLDILWLRKFNWNRNLVAEIKPDLAFCT